MRDKLDIEPTSRTPAVMFDFANNHLKISGESYPEDVTEFYRPVFKALDGYLGALGEGNCRFDFELIYLNSSSAKAVMMLMDMLGASAAGGAACQRRRGDGACAPPLLLCRATRPHRHVGYCRDG